MNFPLYIAKRYLFSKKSTNAINVISLISVVGVAVATTALVIVLSVFNGFHDMVASFFTNFDPQIEIVLLVTILCSPRFASYLRSMWLRNVCRIWLWLCIETIRLWWL